MGQEQEDHMVKSREMGRMFVSDEAFNTMLDPIEDAAREFVEKIRAKSDDPVFPPTAIVITLGEDDGEKRTIHVPLPVELMDQRFNVMRALGRQMDEDGLAPIAIFFASEGWGAEYGPCDDKSVRPTNRADRKEIILILGMTMDGRTNLRIIDILRGEDEVVLGKAKNVPYDESSKGHGQSDLLGMFFTGFLDRRLTQMQSDLLDTN
jgi:hypothetical protein